MSRWYEREEVKRVTPKWVDANVSLSDREMELLEIIHERKLVRRDMLEVISPSYRYLGNNRTRIINNSINKLFRSMCIDKIHAPQKIMKGNTPAILALDRAGSILLNVNHKRRIRHNTHRYNGLDIITRELPINYKHVNGVNQLEVDTILFCENSNNTLNDWIIEKPIGFYYGQENITMIPDILMKITFENKVFISFIEFDTGLESIRYKEPPIIKNKIINYRKYKLSKLWVDEFEYFPFLLLVTKDKDRIDFFNKKCLENNIKGYGVYYQNYTNFLNRIGNII